MNFKIKPYIEIDDLDFQTFVSEIYQMSFSMIEDGIISCEKVMNSDYHEMSWGLEVSELLLHKETSILEYHGKFVAEIPTIEIYNMLKEYRDKLKEYEGTNSRS
jgi:hypothetical protein